MKIAYFTTAQDIEEYKSFCIDRNRNANTSNQVFHSNLIECLSLTNEIEVYSCRTDLKQENKEFSKKINNVTWHYLKTKKSSFSNLTTQVSAIKEIKSDCKVAFVDTISPRCVMVAKAFCKKNKIPLIGIVTDNPYNITNVKKFHALLTLRTAKKCDGYICLTEALNTLFNKKKKPYILTKGLSKNEVSTKEAPVCYPYFFYAGTLLKKYGILNLIKAFKKFKDKPVKLVIAGHHRNPEFENAIKDNENIIFLGCVDNDTVLQYESHSIANINPRPYIAKIDKYSVPSKVIEYISKEPVIISGFSSELKDMLMNSILWVDENNSLLDRMKEAYGIDEFRRKAMFGENKYHYQNEFSFEANNKKIDNFILDILS